MQPIIKDSRISVAAIARLLNAGVELEEMVETYPHLTVEAISDAISYYRDYQQEIDDIIAASTPDAMRQQGFVTGPDGKITFRSR